MQERWCSDAYKEYAICRLPWHVLLLTYGLAALALLTLALLIAVAVLLRAGRAKGHRCVLHAAPCARPQGPAGSGSASAERGAVCVLCSLRSRPWRLVWLGCVLWGLGWLCCLRLLPHAWVGTDRWAASWYTGFGARASPAPDSVSLDQTSSPHPAAAGCPPPHSLMRTPVQ